MRNDLAKIIRYGENFGYSADDLSVLISLYLEDKLKTTAAWFKDDKFLDGLPEEKVLEYLKTLKQIV